MQLKVLEVLPGGRAVVSTRGLRRVWVPQEGRVLEDFLTIAEAQLAAATYNECVGDRNAHAVVVSYPDVSRRVADRAHGRSA